MVYWKRSEDSIESCCNLQKNSEVSNFRDKPYPYFYYSTYLVGGGFSASVTNQLVLNFKKGKGKPKQEFKYRTSAICEVANIYTNFFFDYWFVDSRSKEKDNLLIVLPPVSFDNDDNDAKDADDRFQVLLDCILNKCKLRIMGIDFSFIELEYKNSQKSLHSGTSRNPDDIQKNIGIKKDYYSNKMKQKERVVSFFIDDILTSGATFKASTDFLLSQEDNISIVKNLKIYGLFFAKAKIF